MRKVNGCIKSIYLENIFKKKIIGKKKAIKLFFFTIFNNSHKNCIKTFLKLFINKCLKDTCKSNSYYIYIYIYIYIR